MKTRIYTPHLILSFIIALALVLVPLAPATYAQASLKQPVVKTTGLLNLTWTAGTVNNGGHAVTIVTGSTNAAASKTTCAPPLYTSCNFLYADSSGTVAATATLTTAMASGNTLLAYAETDGTVITKLSFPQQANTVYTGGTLLTDCGTSASCASPTTLSGKAFHVVMGTTALASATPSVVTVTAMAPAFTSTSTFTCTAAPIGGTAAIAAAGVAVALVSGSSFTITGPNSVTTPVAWQCWGY